MRRLFLVMAVLGVVAAVLALNSARKSAQARRAHINHRAKLERLELALRHYHDDHGALPPVSINNDHGRPIHSWRALLLPYLDEPELAAEYTFDEPWDGPRNRRLAAKVPFAFQFSDANLRDGTTGAVAIVGADESMVALIEAASLEILWTQPEDLPVHKLANMAFRGDFKNLSHSGLRVAAECLRGDYRLRGGLDFDTPAPQLADLTAICGNQSDASEPSEAELKEYAAP